MTPVRNREGTGIGRSSCGGVAVPTTVAEQVRRAQRCFSADPALLTAEGWISFGQLADLADAAAHLMADEGARFGDRIVLYFENGAELRVLEHAVLGNGLVRVALSPRLHPREVAEIVLDSNASLVCCSPGVAPAVREALAEAGASARVLPFSNAGSGENSLAVLASRPRSTALEWPSVSPADIAMLIYSSGTTGTPKAAVVTHGAWVAQTSLAMRQLPEIGRGDVVLAVAPMTHFGGSIGLDCAMSGAATVPVAAFEPHSVLSAIDEYGVTVLPLAPIMLTRLVEALDAGARRPPPIRAIPYGGSPVPPGTLAAAVGYFPGALVQYYGLAEALAPIACLTAGDHDALLGSGSHGHPLRHRLESAGRVVDGVQVRLVGRQILVRGETVMVGYWNRDTLNAEVLNADGWLSTGDIARIDDDGYLYLIDRAQDVIISGGFNIYPAEVERVIAAVPGLREAVVFGIPHERWGEGVCAAVVMEVVADPRFAGDGELLRTVVDFCRTRLASYKKPLVVLAVDEIPRNAAGKIDRRKLRSTLFPMFNASVRT